jgi:Tol biopolymer transport system component/DNA-binding winged helix-turn-helix (wHTH) protein
MTRSELLRDGEPVMLSQKAFHLLAVLVENHDRVMTKDELIAAVWRDAFVSEDSLSQLIFMLRRALGDDPGAPRFIATSHRRGYRFIAQVTDVVPGAEGTSPPPAVIAPAVAPAVAAASLIAASSPSASVAAPAARLRWRSLMLPAAIVLTAAATWTAARTLETLRATPASEPLRAVQSAPPGTTFVSGGMFSPDGRMLAFVARDERTRAMNVWVRDLSSGEDRAFAETEGAEEPFWSPDSRQLAFSSNGRLRIVDLHGGAARAIADVGFGLRPGGGSWSRDGTILFAPRRSGLHAVDASGGPVRAITTLDAAAKESAHRLPRFLPDGRHFLDYIDSADSNRAGTYVGSIDGGDSTRVVDGTQASYAAGHLIYVKEGALFSQPFDPDRLRVTGAPVSLATGVSEARAVSATESHVAFVENASAGKLVWFNRAGERVDEIDSSAPLANPVLMGPKQVVGANNDLRGVQGVWIGDLDRRVFTRLTSRGITPVPSPDNRKVVFTSDHAGGIRDLYVLDLQGGPEQLLLRSRENKLPTDWTRDGRYVVYASSNEKTGQDVWMLPMEGDRTPVPVISSPFNEIQARVSPDGRWIAYASDETGRWEVYLQSFPVAGNKQVVSVGGGGQPQWRADGIELFYLALDRTLMSVSLTGGSAPQIGRPKPLFQLPVADVVGWRNRFTPDADGRNFLVSSVETTERPEIVFLINALR